MTLAFTIRFSKAEMNNLMENYGALEEDVKRLPHDLAKKQAQYLRREFIRDETKAPRGQTASRMRAIRRSENTSEVRIPLSSWRLDRMRPHYVSLKRTRNITDWARRYYDGTPRTSGRSRVFRGPRGGVRGGYLYVTPHPFIDRSAERANRWLQRRLGTIKNRIQQGG